MVTSENGSKSLLRWSVQSIRKSKRNNKKSITTATKRRDKTTKKNIKVIEIKNKFNILECNNEKIPMIIEEKVINICYIKSLYKIITKNYIKSLNKSQSKKDIEKQYQVSN